MKQLDKIFTIGTQLINTVNTVQQKIRINGSMPTVLYIHKYMSVFNVYRYLWFSV